MQITKLREQKSLNKGQLAAKAQISLPYLSQLESGKKVNPSKKTLEKLAKALDATIAELY
jgi:transcriptional regulator with XRE-family HTH domain